MTVLDTLNFVAFNPLQNNNPIAIRRRKLIAKIDEQIQLAANKDYTPTQHKWVTDEHGNQRKVEVAKRVKRWWTASDLPPEAPSFIMRVCRLGFHTLRCWFRQERRVRSPQIAQAPDALLQVLSSPVMSAA